MTTKLCLWCTVGLLGISSAVSGDEKKLRELEKARFIAAEKAYAAAIAPVQSGTLGLSGRYMLSVCLLNAQRDLDSSNEIAAYQGHYDRMLALSKVINRKSPKSDGPPADLVSACELFLIEAEYWLENAKLRNKK